MAQHIGQMEIGSIVKLNENGVPADYVIISQGAPRESSEYDADGTWLMRVETKNDVPYFTSDPGARPSYSGSNMDSWLSGQMYNQYDSDVKNKILNAKIPIDNLNGIDPVSINRRVFLVRDAGEIKLPTTIIGIIGSGGFATRSFVNVGGSSPINYKVSTLYVWKDSFQSGNAGLTASTPVRPVVVLDSSVLVGEDGTIKFYDVSSISVPDTSMVGEEIPISWSAAEEATTYVLERKADTDADWVQLYSGANLSYTDTAGSWTSVQYRVKAGSGSDFGDYTTSKSIPVVSASALVISGEDEDLGTITGDLTYTIISDTGNPITLERRVNGKLVAKGTVNSGFSYPISVFDLPTGAGTIELSASVTSGSAPVTATRTWTYTKAPVTFPEAGGPAQLAQGGKNVFPATIAEAVRTPTALGGTLDKTLELLAPLLNSAVISVGTYTGTGTFGADNPNTLTFDSAPSIVTIYGGGKTLAISSTDTEGTAYIDGTSAKWYADTAENQLNVSGTTYSYIAIGEVTES